MQLAMSEALPLEPVLSVHPAAETYCHVMECDYRRSWIGYRIYWTLWYSAWLRFTVQYLTHTSVHVTSHCRCLVAASNGGHSPYSGFPKCPRPQLPVSNSNSSQWLDLSSSLTNSRQSPSYFTTDGQSASLSWYRAPAWGPRPDYYCQTVAVWRPLWREDGSVVYDCCWPSPAQSYSDPSPAGLITTFYCLRFEVPPTWRTRSP
jgi:hypothetical protein